MFGLWHVINEEVANEINDLHERAYIRIARKNLRDTSNPFEIEDTHFKKLFRLNKELARDVCDQLSPHFAPSIRSTRLPIHIRVLVALNFYAHGSYQTCVGEDFNLGISQAMVSRALTEVSNIICENLVQDKIVFPSTPREMIQIKQRFYEKFHIPNVIGCIDGTHIAIVCPPVDDPIYPGGAYYN